MHCRRCPSDGRGIYDPWSPSSGNSQGSRSEGCCSGRSQSHTSDTDWTIPTTWSIPSWPTPPPCAFSPRGRRRNRQGHASSRIAWHRGHRTRARRRHGTSVGERATRGLPDQLELKSRFEELDDGLDSLLGRESGGLDLSVGEWQRLALARARYQAAHLLLLDEPSSAADSDALATLTSALGHAGGSRGKDRRVFSSVQD